MMKFIGSFSIVIFVCISCKPKAKPKNYANENVIILKQVAVNDSMNLYLYKMDGRAVSSTSYITYQKELCDINRGNFIVKGTFDNLTISKADTILIWSIHDDSIDSIQPSKFHYKKMKLALFDDSLSLNYDQTKKLYLGNICK